MENVSWKVDGGLLIISLTGYIDSANAGDIEKKINECCQKNVGRVTDGKSLIIDAEYLEYVSSAGLRIFLRLRKSYEQLKIINVSTDVYEILEMTGFTEMISVEKAYYKLSVKDCEVIGEGANGKVYKVGQETIVKVYVNPDSMEKIQNERMLAKKAFVLGIPTAISYAIVKVDEGNGAFDKFGSIFELLNASSLAKLMIDEPGRRDEYLRGYIDLLKKIHSTELKPGEMKPIKQSFIERANGLEHVLPNEQWEKLCRMLNEIPDDNHLLHGDYHIKNIMVQNGEMLLIDMDTLAVGNPIFELAGMYLTYVGFSETDHDNIFRFIGFTFEEAVKIWRKSLALYLGTDDEEVLKNVEKKARIVGYTRLLHRTVRRKETDTEEGRARYDCCLQGLEQLLACTDELAI